MIVQSSSAPWVILIAVVMAGCALSGMLIGNVGPFNSRVVEAQIPVQQTQGAPDSIATQSALEVVQTQLAPLIQQTAMAAQLTLAPLQQSATQVAGVAAQQQLQAQITQTAMVSDQNLAYAANNATATAIARAQIRDYATDAFQLGILVLSIVLVCGLVLTFIVIRIIGTRANARAREKEAQAKLLGEQRSLMDLRARIEAQKREQAEQYPSPMSLMKKPGNGKDLLEQSK